MSGAGGDSTPAGFRIQLLGEFAVTVDGQPIPPERFRLRKARGLVKLLALAPDHRIQRDQAIEALWPDADPARALNNFYQVLHAVRRILDPRSENAQRFILLQDDYLFFNPDCLPEVDARQFQEAAGRALHGNDPAAYQGAVDLYTGDLLPEDLYEDWAAPQREALRQTCAGLLLKLAGLYESAGEYQAGVDVLQRLVADDPLHEEAHAVLMRLYAVMGQRRSAVRQYEVLRDTLQRELDAQPDALAEKLYQDILSGRLAPSVEPPQVEIPQPVSPPPAPDTPVQPPQHNLPGRLSSFVGRSQEIERVQTLLEQTRLVTLTGPGGVGKTRLSIQVASAILTRFPDGAWFFELGGVSEPEHILPLIASVFQLREARERTFLQAVQEYLQPKRALLVLDNCEHLVEPCASLAETLLQHCQDLRILATSREPLASEGEVAFPVPALSTPDPELPDGLEALARSEAVRLFIERAELAFPGFRLEQENAATIARICRRLDGLPLAIELAAARVGVLSVEGIAARLEDRFKLLTGGSRSALPRYQTIRASIDWSYELLSTPEQALLQRLSVFAGGWSFDAAEQVCSEPDSPPLPAADAAHASDDQAGVLDLLAQLVKKSLVVIDRDPARELRYRLLETVRQYAAEKWAAAQAGNDRDASLRDRHLQYYLRLAEDTQPLQRTGRRFERVERLRLELDNIYAALSWAMSAPHNARVESGLQLVTALQQLWAHYGYYSEGRGWIERGLDLLDHVEEETPGRHTWLCAKAHWIYGMIMIEIGTVFESLQLLEKSLILYRQVDLPRERVGLMLTLVEGIWRINRGRSNELLEECLEICRARDYRWELAQGLFLKAKDLAYFDPGSQLIRDLSMESVRLNEETGDVWSAFNPLSNLGLFALFAGDFTQARGYFEQAARSAREMNDLNNLFYAFTNLGMLDYFEGGFRAMQDDFQECLALANRFNSGLGKIYGLRNMAVAADHQGNARQAAQWFAESLRLAESIDDAYGVLACLVGMAGLAASLGQPETAARLAGAGEAYLEGFGKPLDPIEKAEFAYNKTRISGMLGEPAFAQYWREGRERSLEEALAEARLLVPPALL